jgi:hypothetical protein
MKYSLISRTLFAALCGLSALQAAAQAQEGPAQPVSATVHMDLATAARLNLALAGTFDEGQIAMLSALGHQQAVAATCATFQVDPDAFDREMHLIYHAKDGKSKTLTAQERASLENKALIGFGMAYGAQLAIAAYDETAFCAAAEMEKAAGKVKHLVWAK